MPSLVDGAVSALANGVEALVELVDRGLAHCYRRTVCTHLYIHARDSEDKEEFVLIDITWILPPSTPTSSLANFLLSSSPASGTSASRVCHPCPWLISPRLLPLTGDHGDEPCPKALLPIANRPMIEYVLSWIEQSGIKGDASLRPYLDLLLISLKMSFSCVLRSIDTLYIIISTLTFRLLT